MTETKPKKILIVDDHPILRAGMARVIEEDDRYTVCGEAESADQALTAIETAAPDLLLVDISLANSNGIDLIRKVCQRGQKIPALVVSMHDEPVYIERAFKSGACGYMLKRESVQNVIRAIQTIFDGKSYVSESVSSSLVESLKSQDATGDRCPREVLSKREFEIFQLLGEGLSRKEIAEKLFISLKTVESHIERIKNRLDVDSGTKLVHYAIRHHAATK